MTRHVTFDLWRTLLVDTAEEERSAARIDALAEVLPLDRDQIACALDRTADALWRRQDAELRDPGPVGHADDFLRHAGASVPSDVRDRVAQIIASTIVRFPPSLIDGAAETLQATARRTSIGLVSNTGFSPGPALRRVLHHLGVAQHFSAFAFSDEVGWAKPHPAIFAHALAHLGARPADVLHVGDTLAADVAGAQAHGMRTVWLASEVRVGADGIRPDATVDSIRGAAPLIERWLLEGVI